MKDDFAGKLIAGKAVASAKASWWPRHCRALGRYLVLSGGATPNALVGVREELGMGCIAWETAVPSATKNGLMKMHTMLEMALVDAARMNAADKIDQVGALLLQNAVRQSDLCAAAIEGFPKHLFRKLLEEHVFLFAKAVRAHKEGRRRACEEIEHGNTLALAAFTAEWL